MGHYELLLLIHPDAEGVLNKVTDKVKAYVENASGKIIKEDNWGKRRLAYPIAKQDYGVYFLYELELPVDRVAPLERELKLSEEVLRYLTTLYQAIPERQRQAAERRESEGTVREPLVPRRETAAKAVKIEQPEAPALEESERREELDKKLAHILNQEEQAEPEASEEKVKEGE